MHDKIMDRGSWIVNREDGFTLVELMITMVIFISVLVASTGIFVPLLNQFKQQSKITQTNTEGIIGLELMRRDIEHAGYGLPWLLPSGFACGSITDCGEAGFTPGNNYNDITNNNPPRAVISNNNVNISNIAAGSDYLVIKAVNVSMNDTSQRWTNITAPSVRAFSSTAPGNPRVWDVKSDAFCGTPANPSGCNPEYVIVLSSATSNMRQLITSPSGGTPTQFYTTYAYATMVADPWPPTDQSDTRLVYGIADNGAGALSHLRMPFNRADYFIATSVSIPSRCAPNTGVLQKGVLGHSNGSFTYYPLLDCVADMQVVYGLDMNDDGQAGTYADGGTTVGGTNDSINVAGSEGATATTVLQTVNDPALLRQRLKEVRVYILAHEGQKDPSFTYSTNSVTVGETLSGQAFGRNYNLSSDMRNYRWKVYTLVVKLNNMYSLPK